MLCFRALISMWLSCFFYSFFTTCLFSAILCCRLPTPSTFDMVIPANAVGKVMGKGGANIANIRKVGHLFLNFWSFCSC